MSRRTTAVRGLGVQSRCEACGTPIWFARHASTGRVMPIDAASTDEGNLEIVERGGDGPVVAHVFVPPPGALALPGLADETAEERPRYRSHFLTCSDPDRFRRTGGGGLGERGG